MIEQNKQQGHIIQEVQHSTMHHVQEHIQIKHQHMTVQKQVMHSVEVIQVQN